MPWRVVPVTALPAFRLRARFADGLEGEVAMRCLVHSRGPGAFSSVADRAVFARAFVAHGAVSWPGDIDLAPDTMYAAINRGGV
jgi:hypothetical protein